MSTPVLTAQASENTIELRWDAVSGAVRYELWTWWNGETGWQQIGGDDLTGTTHTHTDVTKGTTYWYTIRAVGIDGEASAWSEYVTAIPSSTPPTTATPTITPTATSTSTATPTGAPPQGESGLSTPVLTAQASENTIELRWDAVSGAVRYDLRTWWNRETGWQQIGGDDLTGTTHTHTDVTKGTTYWYTIRAVGIDGEASAWSELVSTTPISSSVPSLSAKVTANGIELTWTAVRDAVRYDLWVWTTADGWLRLDDGNLTGTSFTHSGLTPGTTYWYTIRAVDATGAASEWSQYTHATVPAS